VTVQDTTGLSAVLGRTPPFDRANAEALAAVAPHLRQLHYAAGDVVVAQGDEADSVYVVVDGTLSVRIAGPDGSEIEVAALGPGAVVGEIAVVAGGRRSATVAADTTSELLELSGQGITELLDAAPELAATISEEAIRRLRHAQFARFAADLFPGVDPSARAAIGAAVDWRRLGAGELLFDPGDPADAAYVVVAGRLKVTVTRDGQTHRRELAAGELLGESALISDAPRAGRVEAVRDTDLAVLPRAVFDRLVVDHPAAMMDVTRSLIARERGEHPSRSSHTSVAIALLPTYDGFDMRLLASRLAETLGAAGDILHLWSARVDSLMGRAGIAQSGRDEAGGVRLTHWLDEIAAQHAFVLFELDREWSPWNDRVLRHADRVVVLARASDDPAPGPAEARLRDHPAAGTLRTTLVLFHDRKTEVPQGTATWLEQRDVTDHLHLRDDDATEIARLGRMLAGTATSLVLGGGGARGFAHLGVIRAMRELGIPIDMIGGASMGSIMAVPVAADWPVEEFVPRLQPTFRHLLDYTLPMVSLVSGKRITRAIRSHVGDIQIEDLWRPFFCVSTNLTAAEAVVHDRGPLATALRASVAIPGVIPPVSLDGDLLIDGGVLDNLPIALMRDRNPTGHVVAVDVIPPRGARAKGDVGMSVSGWGLAMRKVVPGVRAPRLPGLAMTLLGSTLVTSMRDRNHHRLNQSADLFLDIDVRGQGLLDFDAIVEVSESGYQAALPRLASWLETGVDPGSPD
jgi:predicted acylesterase/phospholipase RssA/CRP-like cAMP-binding protein